MNSGFIESGQMLAVKQAQGRSSPGDDARTPGRAGVETGLVFSAPVPGYQVIDRVRRTLNLGLQSSAASAGLHLAWMEEDGSAMIVGHTDRVGVSHLGYLVATDFAESGCTGFGGLRTWTEREGVIVAIEAIERINDHLRAALVHLDGRLIEAHRGVAREPSARPLRPVG